MLCDKREANFSSHFTYTLYSFQLYKESTIFVRKTSTLLVTKKDVKSQTILLDHYDQYLACSYCVKSKKPSLALVCLLMTAFFFTELIAPLLKTPNSL